MIVGRTSLPNKAQIQSKSRSQQRNNGAVIPKGALNARQRRFSRRHGLRSITTRGAVRACGCRRIGPGFDSNGLAVDELIRQDRNGRGFVSKFQTCGAVLVCPVCFAKVRQKKAIEIQEIMQAHRAAEGSIYEQTLTIPHARFDKLEDLIVVVRKAWERLIKTRKFKELRDFYRQEIKSEKIDFETGEILEVIEKGFGITQIRAFEATHGGNGWHPHLHVLWFFQSEPDADDLKVFKKLVIDTWGKVIEEVGRGEINTDLFDLRPIEDGQAMSKYISKAVYEVTRQDNKMQTTDKPEEYKKGRQPFEILDGAIAGCKDDKRLWNEWEVATKGLRSLSTLSILKNAYNLIDEKTDKELAAEEDELATDYAFVPGGSVDFWGVVGIEWYMYELVRYMKPDDYRVLAENLVNVDRPLYYAIPYNAREPVRVGIRKRLSELLTGFQSQEASTKKAPD